MKRTASIILILALLLGLCACGETKNDLEDPVNLYYLRVQNLEELYHGSADSVIMAEQVEGLGHRKDMAYFLSLYFRGPTDAALVSPCPAGTKLVGYELADSVLYLTLSDNFAELSGIDLTLACACLTMTFLELTEAEAVQIQAETELLDGKSSIIMDADIILLLDDGTITTETE